MIEVYDGTDVWGQLAPTLRARGLRRAAIAYIGSGAKNYLGLKKGDVLVFDGHVSSVEQGHVNLDEVRKMIKAGVTLYSRPGLHSKILVLEAATPLALVGSANASRTSATKKSETVVMFDDEVAVQSVRDAIAGLTVGLKALQPAWADEMEPHLPPHRSSDSQFERVIDPDLPLATADRPMWVWPYDWDENESPAEVSAAVAQAEAARGVRVTPVRLTGKADAEIFDRVSVGHSALMIPFPVGKDYPRRNARVEEPELVIDKVAAEGGTGGHVLTAARLRPAHKPFKAIEELFDRLGADVAYDYDRLPPKVREQVFALFGP